MSGVLLLAIVVVFIAKRETPCLPKACESTLVADQQRQATGKPVLIYFNGWATSDLQNKLAEDVLLKPQVQTAMGRFVQLEFLHANFTERAGALIELGFFPSGLRVDMPAIYFLDTQKRQIKILARTDLSSLATSPTGAQDFVKILEEVEETIRAQAEEEEEEEEEEGGY